MKIAEVRGTRDAGVVDVPDPKIRGEFVVVKVHVAPMCTEYKGYLHGGQSRNLGHEAVGEVVEVAQSGRVALGDRVVVMPTYPCGACRHCLSGGYIHCEHQLDALAVCDSPSGTATYAQYLIKQDWMLIPIPAAMSYEHASMACCGLGPTFGAMQTMGVDSYDTIVITGMGPVGLGGVINATYRGARVIAVEGHPYRRELAAALGAQYVLDPAEPETLDRIRELTGNEGADCAIDCTGVPAAQRLLVDAVRRRGQVAFVGEGSEVSVHVSRDMIRKGLTLRGSWHWSMADVPQMMQLISAVGSKLDQQITHQFPLDGVQDAFELQTTKDCGKVLLRPWG